MDKLKKLVSQAFGEIDDCMEYCRHSLEAKGDQDLVEAYLKVASTKADSASTLFEAAGKHATSYGESDNDASTQAPRYAWGILSEIIGERIRSAREFVSSIERER